MPTANAQPVLRLFARDSSGSRGQLAMYVRAGTAASAGLAAATSLRGLLDPISDATFERQQIEYNVIELSPDQPGARPAYIAGVFVFETGTAGEYAIIEIPGLREEYVQITGNGSGVIIDQAAPAVAAFIAQLVAGVWCNPWGVQLVNCAAAFVQIRP